MYQYLLSLIKPDNATAFGVEGGHDNINVIVAGPQQWLVGVEPVVRGESVTYIVQFALGKCTAVLEQVIQRVERTQLLDLKNKKIFISVYVAYQRKILTLYFQYCIIQESYTYIQYLFLVVYVWCHGHTDLVVLTCNLVWEPATTRAVPARHGNRPLYTALRSLPGKTNIYVNLFVYLFISILWYIYLTVCISYIEMFFNSLVFF